MPDAANMCNGSLTEGYEKFSAAGSSLAGCPCKRTRGVAMGIGEAGNLDTIENRIHTFCIGGIFIETNVEIQIIFWNNTQPILCKTCHQPLTIPVSPI